MFIMHLRMRITHESSQGVICLPNWFQISKLQTLDKNIQALLQHKIKVVLRIKGATKSAYENDKLLLAKNTIF